MYYKRVGGVIRAFRTREEVERSERVTEATEAPKKKSKRKVSKK